MNFILASHVVTSPEKQSCWSLPERHGKSLYPDMKGAERDEDYAI